MIRLSLATALVLAIGTAGAASADPSKNGPKAAFNYTSAQSVAENYDAFRETAHKACRMPLRDSLRVWAAETAQCEANLIEQAVRSFGISELTEWHIAQTKGVSPPQQFASR